MLLSTVFVVTRQKLMSGAAEWRSAKPRPAGDAQTTPAWRARDGDWRGARVGGAAEALAPQRAPAPSTNLCGVGMYGATTGQTI